MLNIKNTIAHMISDKVDTLTADEIINILEYPPNSDMGDVALPCFKLSRILKKSPVQIADELADILPKNKYIDRIESVSGYLNFFVNRDIFIEETVDRIMKEKDAYGSSNIGKGKNIVIDYSAPNIAKPFHIGHLRSTSIGNALYHIFKFAGYNCIGINHLGSITFSC